MMRVCVQAWLAAILPWTVLITCLDTTQTCPDACRCKNVPNRDVSDPSELRGKKVTCTGTDDFRLVNLDSINLATLPPNTIHLVVRNHDVTEIKSQTFAGLKDLRKLDLSRNKIMKIEDGAFKDLVNLERLDLSLNDLTSVNASMFVGMTNLDKLSLSRNSLKTLPEGVFDGLEKLKKLDFMSPLLWCDCHIQWIVRWQKSRDVNIPPRTQCAGPPDLAKVAVRDLKKKNLHCNRPVELEVFDVFPSKSQIVFQGDDIPFQCRASLLDDTTKVTWYRSGKPVLNNETVGVIVANSPDLSDPEVVRNPSDNTLVSSLTLRNVEVSSSGVWSCLVQTALGNVTKTVTIVVISDDTIRCPPLTVNTNKGLFHWPKAVGGTRMEQECASGPSSDFRGKSPHAFYTCGDDGTWTELDTSQCQYVQEITRVLEQYTLTTLNQSNVLETAVRFRQYITRAHTKMNDKMDVLFIATIIGKLTSYVSDIPELVDVMLDIVTMVMDLRDDLLIAAQIEQRACSRMVQVIEHLPAILLVKRNYVSYYSRGVALEAFRLTPSNYHGIHCWVDDQSAGALDRNQSNFRCEALDESRPIDTAPASIVLPRNLLKVLRQDHAVKGPLFNIQFVVYKNARLFPIMSSTVGAQFHNKLIVTSHVISSKVSDLPVDNLTSPVVIRLQVAAPSQKYWPVYWDFSANEGHGAWLTRGCQSMSVANNISQFHCNHLTNFAVMQVRGPVPMELFLMEPVVYAGSLVCVVCLIATMATYATCHRYIRIPKKAKHSLVNMCMALVLLVLLFTLAIMRTDNTLACQIIGMLTHYLTICLLFWITISSSNMYKKYYKAQKPPAPPDEYMEPVPPKPIMRFYLVGWGIALIVCGITAAVDIRKYSTSAYCFLTWDTCLGALIGPVGLLVTINAILFLCISCVIRPQVATYRDETELGQEIECRINEQTTFSDSISSTSSTFDQEHHGRSQLHALIFILFMYLFTWTCAAFVVGKPLEIIPYRDLIFSYAYGASVSVLGIFILVYFCLSRQDARMCWTRFFCCRKQVFYLIPPSGTSGGRVPVPQSLAHTMVPARLNGHVVVHAGATSSGGDRTSIESGTLTNRSTRSANSGHNGKTIATINSLGTQSLPAHAQSHRSLRSHASQPAQLNQGQGYMTESSLNSSGVADGVQDRFSYFYNTKQNNAAKRFWEKKHRRDAKILRSSFRDTDASSLTGRSSVDRTIAEMDEKSEVNVKEPSGHSLPPMPGQNHDSSPGSSVTFPPPPPPIALVTPLSGEAPPAEVGACASVAAHCAKHGLEQPCAKCFRAPDPRGGCYYSLDRRSASTHRSGRSSNHGDSESEVGRRRANKRRSRHQWEEEFKDKPKRMHAFARRPRPDSRPHDSDYSQGSGRHFPRSISAYDQFTALAGSALDDFSSTSSDEDDSYWTKKHGRRLHSNHHHHHHQHKRKQKKVETSV